MSDFALKISNISKYFGENLILENIDFCVKNGDIFGFVGLNGVGKTTLIKIITDLSSKDSGEIEIFGVKNQITQSRNLIFYLPEKFSPSQNITGKEFLNFCLDFYNKNIDQKDLEEIANNLDFDLQNLTKKIGNYSKGMTQKLGLISGFLSKTKLLIFDEPMSGLDVKARIALKKQFIEYKKLGNSIFFSSHILSDIEEICDEIAILHNCKVDFVGSPSFFKEKFQEKNLDLAFLKKIS